MTIIWKFPLEIVDKQTVSMPKQHRLLNVYFQGNTLCLWAMVNSESELMRRVIRIYGTGNPVTPNQFQKYLGTVQDMKSSLVWHVFTDATPYEAQLDIDLSLIEGKPLLNN